MALRAAITSVVFVAFALHAWNLSYLADAQGCDPVRLVCPADEDLWFTNDAPEYQRIAKRIRERGFFSVSYMRRLPGYPGVLAAVEAISGSTETARWLGPLFAGLACGAVAWLSFVLTDRRGAAVCGGILFCAWPGAYSLSPLLLTDSLHGSAAIIAIVLSVYWVRSQWPPAAAAAAIFWMFSQLLRLTFFSIPLFLPVLLWKRNPSRSYAVGAVAIVIAACAVPSFIVASNWLRHGVAVPNGDFARALMCYDVPRLLSEQGRGSFLKLREDCHTHYADMDWKKKIPMQTSEGWRLHLEHPGDAFRSHVGEFLEQLAYPSRPHYRDEAASLFREFTTFSPPLLTGFWILACIGLLYASRSAPPVGLFIGSCVVLVAVPASFGHLMGSRIRYPIELLAIPLVVSAGFHLVEARHRIPSRLANAWRSYGRGQ